MTATSAPYLAWYGDDFTGAAAVMEVLEFAGYASVLFLDLPDAAALARFPGRFAVGVAGDARSRNPSWMNANLPGMFAALRATGARIVHYKACSTMDSAPGIGSIGRASEIGLADGGWAPMIFAAPTLGRWQAFGNLFARAPGGIARLDRHPTMRHHPVTPMDEADVRLHVARQTDLAIDLVDCAALAAGDGPARLSEVVAAGARIVAIDIMDAATLKAAGQLLWQAADEAPLFALGSQGVEYALVAARPRLAEVKVAERVKQVVVISGSASPDTARQIAVAEAQGFAGIRVDAVAALYPHTWASEAERATKAALQVLDKSGSPILHTALGPDDPALAHVASARKTAGIAPEDANRNLARALGDLLAVILRANPCRAVIAGGDTSSHATRGLGITALTAKARIAPGAPLLEGHRPDGSTIELVLKGGQMGRPDFFITTRDGLTFPAQPKETK